LARKRAKPKTERSNSASLTGSVSASELVGVVNRKWSKREEQQRKKREAPPSNFTGSGKTKKFEVILAEFESTY
jgi:hypothetical protein